MRTKQLGLEYDEARKRMKSSHCDNLDLYVIFILSEGSRHKTTSTSWFYCLAYKVSIS